MARTLLNLLIGILLGAGVTLLVGPYGPRYRPAANQSVERAPPAPQAVPTTIALGTIEPRDGLIRISSPLAGTQILSVAVKEGDRVKSGQLLVALDTTAAQKELELARLLRDEGGSRQTAEREAARRQIAAAELALRQLAAGGELQLAAQDAQMKLAIAKSEQAGKELGRLIELHALPEPLASSQQIELQRLVVQAAEAEQHAAQIGKEQLEQSRQFQREKAELELESARQTAQQLQRDESVQSLEKRVELASLQLSQTQIVAPSDGVVLSVLARPGEVVAAQPLLQMADLDRLVCVAEVDVAQLARLDHDQPATVSGRALGSLTVPVRLEWIGNVAAQPALYFSDPRMPVDRTVGKVVLGIENQALQPLASQLISLVGLQVEVSIPLKER